MYPIKRYHFQLNEGDPWRTELGYSLAHVMATVANLDTIPHLYFVTEL